MLEPWQSPISKITIHDCLFKVEQQWRSLPENSRPWGTWIAYHQPISQGEEFITTDVISVWFLTQQGIQNRNVWEYIRFRAVQSMVKGIFAYNRDIGYSDFALVQCQRLL